MVGDALDAVAAPLNRRILATLAIEPGYARRIAGLIDASENEVSRRLSLLERLGLLESRWERQRSNVKVYTLRERCLEVDLTAQGPRLRMPDAPSAASPQRMPAAAMPLPQAGLLVGREDELAALEGADVVIVEGMPGIGKTALLAHHVDGTQAFWITFRGTETVAWLATKAAMHFAACGGEGPLGGLQPGGHDAAERLLAHLRQPGTVAVLDDVHRVTDPALRSFVADAIQSLSGGRLLIASRDRIPHAPRPGLRVLELGGLDDSSSAAVLEHARIPVPEALHPRLREETGGHPLALVLLAEAASRHGLEPLLDRRPEHELTEFLLEHIDEALTDAERTALGHASVFPHMFQADDVQAMGSRHADRTLSSLRRRRLVGADESGYRLPEVIRNFFYTRLQDRPRLHRLAARRRTGEGLQGHLEAMHHLLAAGDRAAVVALLRHDLDIDAYGLIDEGYRRMYGAILDTFTREDLGEGEAGDEAWAQILDERGDLAFHADAWQDAMTYYAGSAALFSGRSPVRWGEALWKEALCSARLGDTDRATRLCMQGLAEDTGASRPRLAGLLEELRTGSASPSVVAASRGAGR